jgi:nitrogen regulatory protein P-II 1
MKKIEAYIKPERFDQVKKALEEDGHFGMSVIEVKGRGGQKGISIQYRGGIIEVDLIPKIKLELFVKDVDEEKVVEKIVTNGRTGKIGDGRIFVSSVERSIRVRTGEIET